MARNLTTAFEAATLASTVIPVVLVEALFDSSPVRLWTGLGDLSWNSVVWTGAGSLLGVGSTLETQEIRATGVDVTLSGIPTELLSLALTEKYQGRECRIYLAAMNTNTGALIADPYMIYSGRMDTMTVSENGDTSSIGLATESRLIDLERSRERRYENEDQQLDWPGDLFFQYVPSIQDAQITWGRS
jgi:hypothetical protein